MGNPIFNFFLLLVKLLKEKNLKLKYGPSHFKTAFKVNFGLQELVKL